MTSKRPHMVLVDVSSLFFRAFYAIRPLTSPTGVPVNAVYGFLSMVLKILRDEKPAAMAFCFDRPEPSFRKDLDPNYKANRTEMPEDLVPQIPYIRKIGEALGVVCIDRLGFEADDLIGTLALNGASKGFEVSIVSGDKDFAQLVSPHIFLVDTMKDLRMGPKEVREKWGVLPEQMRDYLAIVGDSSDNVPGVKGLGPKGAQKLIEAFGSLEEIYRRLEEVTGSTKTKLEHDRDQAFLSQKLVTIVTDVEIPKDPSDYQLQPVRRQDLESLLAELNFKNLRKNLEQLPNWGEGAVATASKSASASEPSTTSSSPAAPVSSQPWRLSEVPHTLPRRLWILDLDSGIYGADLDQFLIFPIQENRERWAEALSAGKLELWSFEAKSLLHRIFELGDSCGALKIGWDTTIAGFLCHPGDNNRREDLVARWLREAAVDPLQIEHFVDQEFRLCQKLQTQLEEIGLRKWFETTELPLAKILFEMEQRGLHLDTELLKKQGETLAVELKSLEAAIHQMAGSPFNVGSPKQLAQVLFTTLNLPPSKKTKTGYSTDNEVLEKLKGAHPIIEPILEYREVAKLKSTYVDALPSLIKADGRVHSTFNQALTATGRLSSVEPNLQNIPIRTEKGARVRKAFTAGPGSQLLSVDYSQIELRVLAHFSEDPGLIRAFAEDLDIHAATAAEVFSVSLKEVTADQRRAAKAVNFGIAYGQGAFGLAENLGVSRTEAQEIIDRYFARFPGVRTYLQAMPEKAKEMGYVETLTGRRRYLEEIRSNNMNIRKFAERMAINTPIQGTAADIVKRAMVDVVPKVKSSLVLQVHDELLFEGSRGLLESEQEIICQTLESAFPLKVPLKVNAAIGPNWDEAH